MDEIPRIFVDGDACPFKEEVYRVAKRYGLTVFMVCNSALRIPKASWIRPIVVGTEFDAVDDWISEQVGPRDLVVTNDILLAKRCVDKRARVLNTRGRELDEDNIGEALANRELMAHLRQLGEMNTGPKSMSPKYRSAFLSRLDEMIHSIRRS